MKDIGIAWENVHIVNWHYLKRVIDNIVETIVLFLCIGVVKKLIETWISSLYVWVLLGTVLGSAEVLVHLLASSVLNKSGHFRRLAVHISENGIGSSIVFVQPLSFLHGSVNHQLLMHK